VNTDRTPDDNYVTTEIDEGALKALARRCRDITGNPQLIHHHSAGVPCRGHRCYFLEP
jgi:hypothetical protein